MCRSGSFYSAMDAGVYPVLFFRNRQRTSPNNSAGGACGISPTTHCHFCRCNCVHRFHCKGGTISALPHPLIEKKTLISLPQISPCGINTPTATPARREILLTGDSSTDTNGTGGTLPAFLPPTSHEIHLTPDFSTKTAQPIFLETGILPGRLKILTLSPLLIWYSGTQTKTVSVGCSGAQTADFCICAKHPLLNTRLTCRRTTQR